jgi:hypothetical protein
MGGEEIVKAIPPGVKKILIKPFKDFKLWYNKNKEKDSGNRVLVFDRNN